MQAEIALLLEIQEKDIAIRSLRKDQRSVPGILNLEKERIQQIENKLKQKQEELKRFQVDRKELEMDLDSKLESVRKYETQLFQVKTNEEYKALQKEINDLKFAAGLQEDKILEKMEEIEGMHKEMKKAEDELTIAKEGLKQKEKEVDAKLDSISSEISQLEKDRGELVPKVQEELLGVYNRIFDNKSDAALVAVVNNACRGCHMRLPPNVVNEVRKGHNLMICDNCARILYWPKE